MKKILTMAFALLFSAATFAQKEGDNVLRIKTADGDTYPVLLNNVKDIAFEEITPLTMDIEVTDIKQTEMVIDFPMPEGCSHWQMCISKEEFTGSDLEVRQAIQRKYNDDFKDSRYLRIGNFEPGTTYYIYALMYDTDGVVAGLSKTSATTLAEPQATDEFSIDVEDITKTTAYVTFTPKDETMTYYPFVVSEADRAKMIEQYGDIRTADLEYIKYNAESIDFDLNEYLSLVLASGKKGYDTRDLAQGNLTPGTKYYAYCFGMNTDGTFTTAVYEKEFETEAITPSENQITCEVQKTYSDGCDVKVTTTNDDPYLVTTQTAAVWERYLSNHNGDKAAAAADLISLSYSSYADQYTQTGNQEFKVDASSSGSDYVLIVCGYEGGITTDVQIIPYTTLAE